MAETKVLYLHGLGREDLRVNERRILERNARKGIKYVPAYIDWRSKETFHDLLDRITEQAAGLIDNISDEGRLIIEGSSAGGSLAFNVLCNINDKRVSAISHSGRLAAGNYLQSDKRSLEKCAHLGTNQASQSFYASVVYCEKLMMPSLTQGVKDRMLITKPLYDEVVPVSTMVLDGICSITVPMAGHSLGIGAGMLKLPSILEDMHMNELTTS